uniref:Uncharacterized protein n=1 Tax=Rhizophora mucronata TaxID=61149 RepID=A0A2P2JUD0_RHIMU
MYQFMTHVVNYLFYWVLIATILTLGCFLQIFYCSFCLL